MIRHYRVNRMRQPAQCKCGWCNKWMTSQDDCLSTEQKLALRTYARLQGGYWKSRLAVEWSKGIASELLTQVRNIIGPEGLRKLDSQMVKDFNPPKPKQEQSTNDRETNPT